MPIPEHPFEPDREGPRRELTMATPRARRSSLILPVNVPRFVEKAYTRGADAIVLDLEDSVPSQEKASARKLVQGSLALAARGGAEVLVRVNNDATLLHDDIDAAVHPGLDGLAIPKAESAAQIRDIVAQIERLERARGLTPGHVCLSLAIETPRGFLAAEEIARSSDRIATMSIGVEDYCLELGVEPSADGLELLYPVAALVTICKAVGVQPTGLVGSIAGFRDLAVFEQAAQRARQLGCEGAGCIHPDQVTVLNRVFTPDPAKVEYAQRVVEAFEDGVRRGTASVNLDGKMVDVPVYKRAQVILARAQAVANTERRKAEALRRQASLAMTPPRRVNVASGRPLESLGHYSRALRVGDTVLQSGTTAIDRQGNVRGEGEVARQVDAIMRIAEWSMGKAGGRLDDVVRSRIYVTDIRVADAAGRALARYFRDVRPAATLVQVDGLARPTQLIEIELDAVDGARDSAQRISSGGPLENVYAYSRAVRVGERVFISGSTALTAGGVEGPGDMYRQTRAAMDTVFRALAEAGGTPGDLVYTKTFLTDLGRAGDYTRAFVDALGDVRPVSTLLGVPALVRPELLVEIEAEAVLGAAPKRRDIYTEHLREKPRGYARAVVVGDAIWVSGCTSVSSRGDVQAPGDWARQYDLAIDTIGWALGQAGATLDDVVRRRTFTVAGAQQNRPYGQGPAPFATSHPVSLGCRIAGLARSELVVEVEVAAVRGAGAAIESIGPDPVDPLD